MGVPSAGVPTAALLAPCHPAPAPVHSTIFHDISIVLTDMLTCAPLPPSTYRLALVLVCVDRERKGRSLIQPAWMGDLVDDGDKYMPLLA